MANVRGGGQTLKGGRKGVGGKRYGGGGKRYGESLTGAKVGGWGGVSGWGEGSKGATVREWGGGELNGICVQIEFRFRNGLGRVLALRSFRITHLIKAEILAKVCTTRKKK